MYGEYFKVKSEHLHSLWVCDLTVEACTEPRNSDQWLESLFRPMMLWPATILNQVGCFSAFIKHLYFITNILQLLCNHQSSELKPVLERFGVSNESCSFFFFFFFSDAFKILFLDNSNTRLYV